eukprot:363066-Chlamydomonas_euryale.AAC.18
MQDEEAAAEAIQDQMAVASKAMQDEEAAAEAIQMAAASKAFQDAMIAVAEAAQQDVNAAAGGEEHAYNVYEVQFDAVAEASQQDGEAAAEAIQDQMAAASKAVQDEQNAVAEAAQQEQEAAAAAAEHVYEVYEEEKITSSEAIEDFIVHRAAHVVAESPELYEHLGPHATCVFVDYFGSTASKPWRAAWPQVHCNSAVVCVGVARGPCASMLRGALCAHAARAQSVENMMHADLHKVCCKHMALQTVAACAKPVETAVETHVAQQLWRRPPRGWVELTRSVDVWWLCQWWRRMGRPRRLRALQGGECVHRHVVLIT